MRSAFLILLIGALLPAQVSMGTITGTVTDSSGAVVPNASIRIVNEGTNVGRNVTTNGPGIYVATPLPPGNYRVEVSMAGFQPQSKIGLVLSVDQTLKVDFTLSPGEQKQNVQVVARSEQLVETATSSLGEVIEQHQIRDLPLNGRDFTDLIGLNAGAQPSGGFYHINGGRGDANGFLVEGIDVSSPSASMPRTLPSVESLGEFKIITNSFSAEYGRSLGGVITARIASGTNRFRGTLFEYLRNRNLDAKNYFAPFKPKYIFNQFGGSIGGPIVRNKIFFFADYQGARIRQGDPRQVNLPTLAQRTGDFSAIAARIYDPLTNPRVAFPGNIIPVSRLDKAAVRMFSLLPAPNQPGPLNFVSIPHVTNDTNIFNLRLDYNIDERNRLSSHWTRSNGSSDAGSPLGPMNGSALANLQDETSNTASLNYTRIISPKAVNELILGVNRGHRVGPATAGMQYDPTLGVPFLNTSEADIRTTGYPSLSIPAYTSFGGPAGGPYRIIHTVPQLTETFTLVQGRHLLKMGFAYKLRPYNIDQSTWSRGRLVFNATTTNSGTTGGDAAASALLGYPLTATRDASYPWGQRSSEAAAFVQEDWKATKRLTLNLGVRWEYFSPVTEQYDRLSNYDPATNSMLVAAKDGRSSSLVDPNWLNFGPRIGYAYLLTSDGKTVLRGGYGVSFVPLTSQGSGTQIRLTMNPPFRQIYSQTFTALNPTVRISDGLPLPTPAVKNPTGDVYFIPTSQGPPYMQQWNIDIQRALPWDFLADVAYAGSRGAHLTGNVNINQAPPGPTAPALRSRISTSVNQIISLMNRETSSYHALQAKLSRRFSRGFYLLSSYTFSKAIDDGSYTTSDGGGPQDATNWRAERGVSDFNRRHRFVVSYIYELPFGKGRTFSLGKNRVIEHILGGWQLNGITTLQSGSPFTPVVANPRTNAGQGGAIRPDRIASGVLPDDERTIRRWFDRTAFIAQGTGGTDPYHFGNSGRNILIGPGIVNFDASIFKAFAFNERTRLQFRTEMFNAMNTPRFTIRTPASTRRRRESLAPRVRRV